MPVGTSKAFTTTLESSFPLSGVTVCFEVVGVTVLDCDGVGFIVTLDNSFPLSGATVLAAVPAVTGLVWLGVGFTVTFFFGLACSASKICHYDLTSTFTLRAADCASKVRTTFPADKVTLAGFTP